MPSTKTTYDLPSGATSLVVKEEHVEYGFIGEHKMSREELIGLIQADAKFMNERDGIAAYINTLKAGEGLSEAAIYQPSVMVDDNKKLFRQILDAFLGRYGFVLPEIFEQPAKKRTGAAAA